MNMPPPRQQSRMPRAAWFALSVTVLAAAALTVHHHRSMPRHSSADGAEASAVRSVQTEVTQPRTGLIPANALTPAQRRGKHLYVTGTSLASRRITVLLGNPPVETPGSVLTCVNCHRHDGRGKPEGGIEPSTITWHELTRRYGLTHSSGRRRPAYDESTLKRSITMGLDSGGKPLNAAMPRYRMTHEDLADLVAYLKILGRERDPGVGKESIRIGVLLPSPDPSSSTNQIALDLLEAYFERLNQNGGVYHRKIELRFLTLPADPDSRADAARRFLDREQVFALTASFFSERDGAIVQLAGARGVPVVGAVSSYPDESFPLNRHVFYLYSGIAAQARCLVGYALAELDAKSCGIAVVHPDDERLSGVADSVMRTFLAAGCTSVMKFSVALSGRSLESFVTDQKKRGSQLVVLLSPTSQGELLRAARKRGWSPAVLIPGSLASRDLYEATSTFAAPVVIALPTLPSDLTAEGRALYQQLAASSRPPDAQIALRFTVLSAAALLIHGLRETGAAPTRERLIETLEGLYQFRTGFTRPMTFTPNRRVGARGAYAVPIGGPGLKKGRLEPIVRE